MCTCHKKVFMVTFQINRPVKNNQKREEVNGLGGRGAYGQTICPIYLKYFLELCKVWHFISMSIIETTLIWTSDIYMCEVFQWSAITHWTATQIVWIRFSCTNVTPGGGANRHCQWNGSAYDSGRGCLYFFQKNCALSQAQKYVKVSQGWKNHKNRWNELP